MIKKCAICGRALARREMRVCAACAGLFPHLVERRPSYHPHREGRLEYKYREGKRIQACARRNI